MTIFWGAGLLLIGAWLGTILSDLRWMLNSTSPDTVKCSSRYFKVVKPDNSYSWEMLDLYRTDLSYKDKYNEH